MPPLADAPPMRPAEESKQPENTKEEEELGRGRAAHRAAHDPEIVAWSSAATALKYQKPTRREGRVNLWDLSATKAHACVIGPHASTLLDTARGAGSVAEVALGIYTASAGSQNWRRARTRGSSWPRRWWAARTPAC